MIFFFSEWTISNGVIGESCPSSSHPTDNVCSEISQPLCVDRTIRCTPLPDFGISDVAVLNAPNSDDLTEFGTIIQVTCLGRNHYFDFSVPDDLISFYYSTNINQTTFTCNRDG